MPRLNMRGADAVMKGIAFERGGELPFGLFDATAMSDEEADAMHLDANSQRAVDEALAGDGS